MKTRSQLDLFPTRLVRRHANQDVPLSGLPLDCRRVPGNRGNHHRLGPERTQSRSRNSFLLSQPANKEASKAPLPYALFIEILPAKGDQTPNLGVQLSPLMVIIACHAREQPQLSCRYHRRRSQCELSQKLSWTRQLGQRERGKVNQTIGIS